VLESRRMPELLYVGLQAPAALMPELAAFYGERLGLPVLHRDATSVAVEVGETTLELWVAAGAPFYHVALLVPGDRLGAAFDWCRERVELLPDRETGEPVFDFTGWGAQALYFHDPAGSIVELIAHRGLGEAGGTGSFSPAELVGVSEVGIVCDPPSLAAALERELALEVWDGSVEGEGRLAFVGEKARTLILCRAGRPWLPTGRPAEAHPVEVVLAGAPQAAVLLEAGGNVRRGAPPATG
jgi:catechol 2,3-dioxygenase-like lactoylglutathione lyase family enzyme